MISLNRCHNNVICMACRDGRSKCKRGLAPVGSEHVVVAGVVLPGEASGVGSPKTLDKQRN